MASAPVFILRGAVMHHGCVRTALWHHAFVLAAFALRGRPLSAALSSPAPAARWTGSKPWLSTCLPCASPRSEHGILGKRRVKLRSPAVGRTPRGCQPDEQIRPRLSGTLWSAAVRVRGSRAQRRGRSTAQLTSNAPENGDSGERHLFTTQRNGPEFGTESLRPHGLR
jgi:hypothetical protein